MTDSLLPAGATLGLIAGRGDLPATVLKAAKEKNIPCFVLAFKGDTDAALCGDTPHQWLPIEEIARTIEIFKEHNVKHVVMAGKLSRPPLKALQPPALAAKIVAKLGRALFSGDDALFKAIVSLFEEEGFTVLGADQITGDVLCPEGILTKATPDRQARQDIDRGIKLAKQIGQLDIGQAIIIKHGQVLGVEALEGTDRLIERCKDLGEREPGGVLIKAKKPGQERRIDLPAIGPETINQLAAAGFAGVAIEAGNALIINRAETIARANENGLFILGFFSDGK
jgi:UDP-2,3-diacylglucosamine hydrolase